MNKCIYVGVPLLLTSLVSTSYISVTAQLFQPEPTTAQWYVKEGDVFSWYVTKLREDGGVASTRLFYNRTGQSISVTEGDTIRITIMTLGNASEHEGTCRIQTGEKELSTRFIDQSLLTGQYWWIMPIYNRNYWVELVAWSENQTGALFKYTLEGNLLTINSSYTSGALANSHHKAVVDISTGLVHSLHSLIFFPVHSLHSLINYQTQMEIKIDLMTGFWFPNITLPTLLLTGVIGAEIIIIVFLVRLVRRRKLELS